MPCVSGLIRNGRGRGAQMTCTMSRAVCAKPAARPPAYLRNRRAPLHHCSQSHRTGDHQHHISPPALRVSSLAFTTGGWSAATAACSLLDVPHAPTHCAMRQRAPQADTGTVVSARELCGQLGCYQVALGDLGKEGSRADLQSPRLVYLARAAAHAAAHAAAVPREQCFSDCSVRGARASRGCLVGA